jgi:hypothetical protein
MTNGAILRHQADRAGIPLRTLEQVKASLAADKARAKGKNTNLDKTMARMMLAHGRLTAEARAWVALNYPV